VGSAVLLAGQATEAPIDRLTLEGGVGGLDLRDDVPPRKLAPVRWCSRSMASRTAFLQLGRLSATLVWNGGTVMAGPLMVSWRFVLCSNCSMG
jgi:hypothetical protein